MVKKVFTGEILKSLDRYIEDFEINEKTVENVTLKDLIWICGANSHTSCEVIDNYKCPFWKEHIGCMFRGKTPREW